MEWIVYGIVMIIFWWSFVFEREILKWIFKLGLLVKIVEKMFGIYYNG